MRKPKSPLRRQLLEIDAIYNHWCPRRPIERMHQIGKLPPCRYLEPRWLKPLKFFGSTCDRFGLSQASKYVGISREDGAYVFRIYKKNFDVDDRLELLQIACNQVARLYHK
jgi:hypothetical protein